MSAKQGKPIKMGDQPTRQKGDQKAPRPAPKSDVQASRKPGATGGNRNLPR